MATEETNGFFTEDTSRPIQQGDIFVSSGIARLAMAGDRFTPSAWAALESRRTPLIEPDHQSAGLDAAGGRALVMVVSHDCNLDKELHLRARALCNANPDLDEEGAYEQAEADDTLDRHAVVSPIIGIDAHPLANEPSTRGLLRAGRVIGYLPVPAAPALSLPDALVDLGHRTTVDRLTLTMRLTSLSDAARLRLRYALASMDSLRTPDVGAELEDALGHRIVRVSRPTTKRRTVLLKLDDDTVLELLPRPGEPSQDGPRRHRTPRTAQQAQR